MSSLHPREGARYLFERTAISPTGESATYRVAIYTPQQTHEYVVELSLDGQVTELESPPDVDGQLAHTLAAIAKSLTRAAAKSRREDLPPWPRRVLRWRGPGRG